MNFKQNEILCERLQIIPIICGQFAGEHVTLNVVTLDLNHLLLLTLVCTVLCR